MAEGKQVFGDLNVDFNKPHAPMTLISNDDSPNLEVKTLHVSCRSSKFHENKDFLGFVLYQYRGQTEWTLNNVRCKAGYIYLQEAALLDKVPGDTLHARAYYKLFGVPLDKNDVVASGFAYQGGQWKENSATFNAIQTPYTKQKRRDGVTEMKLVKAAILKWTDEACQNFDTKNN